MCTGDLHSLCQHPTIRKCYKHFVRWLIWNGWEELWMILEGVSELHSTWNLHWDRGHIEVQAIPNPDKPAIQDVGWDPGAQTTQYIPGMCKMLAYLHFLGKGSYQMLTGEWVLPSPPSQGCCPRPKLELNQLPPDASSTCLKSTLNGTAWRPPSTSSWAYHGGNRQYACPFKPPSRGKEDLYRK